MELETRTPKGYAPFDLYSYNPALAPAYAFIAFFATAGVLHLGAMIPYRSFFPIPLIIGCGFEATAYYFRTQSHNNVRKTLPFVLQNLLLLVAPPFLAASVYMSPRRIARVLEMEHMMISPRLLTKPFVVVDVACLATQAAGAIMSGSDDASQASQGRAVILTGLVRARSELPWQRFIYGLYAVSALFLIRNISRIFEYGSKSSDLTNSEAYLYGLDGTFMLLIVFCFLILHPGRLRMKARHIKKTGGLLDDSIQLG